MIKLAFWMNMPSFYQADLFRALVKTGKVDLQVILTAKIPEDRARLGWQDDLDGFKYEFLDDRHLVIDAFKKSRAYRDHIHIVNGLWAGRVTKTALVTLLLSRSEYLIYSEAPDPGTSVPILKRKLMMMIGKAIVRNAAGLLPISHFASEYFRSYGADNRNLHPFGYFRSQPAGFKPRRAGTEKSTLNVLFVGQLVHRKGVDILLAAIEPLLSANRNLRLKLVGTGEMEDRYRRWVSEKGLERYVTFEGAVGSGQIMEMMSECDLLALPSRWDGWGMVVNEALMAEVPVLVSDMCGAADLIRDGVNGYVFHSGDVSDLRKKLELFIKLPASSRTELGMAARLAGVKLGAENAADYLVQVLRGKADFKDDRFALYPWVTV